MPITGLQLITVTGRYLTIDGRPAKGAVSFWTSTVIVNSTANEIVFPGMVGAPLDASGAFSLQIPATDDPDLVPSGFSYQVTEEIGGSQRRTYDISLPHNLPGATIDMADIAPVAPPGALTTLVRQPPGGATGYLLTRDTDNPLGVKWATAPPLPAETTRTDTTPFSALRVNPSDPLKGPWVWEIGGSQVNSTFDETSYFGYNLANAGDRHVASEPSFGFVIEQDHEGLDGTHQLRSYFEYRSADGATSYRPVFMAVDRATNLLSFTLQADTFALLDQAGADMAFLQRGVFTFLGKAGADTTFVVKAPTGRSSSLALWNNNAAALLLTALANNLGSWSQGGIPVFYAYATGTHTGMSIGINEQTGAFLVANTGAAGSIVGQLRAKAGQTASILEIQSDTKAILSRFDKAGYFTTRKVAAPADADLANSEGAIWWDPSPVTGGFRYKGKDSAGAILSGIL